MHSSSSPKIGKQSGRPDYTCAKVIIELTDSSTLRNVSLYCFKFFVYFLLNYKLVVVLNYHISNVITK